VINLFEERYGHRPAVYGGVLKSECEALLKGFFQEIR
jgi:tRNA(adenine34) deaminase